MSNGRNTTITIIKIVLKFIAVKVDTDLEPSLAYQYSVQYIPTIVYLKPNGDEVHRTVGYRSVSQLLVDMQTALQNM